MTTSRDRTGLSPDKTPDWFPESLRLAPGEQVAKIKTTSDGGVGNSAAGPVLSGPISKRALDGLLSTPDHTAGLPICLFDSVPPTLVGVTSALTSAPADYPGYRSSSQATMLTTTGTGNTQSIHLIPPGAGACLDAPNGSLILWVYIPDRAALCAGSILFSLEMWAGTGTSPDGTYWRALDIAGPFTSGLSRIVIDKAALSPGATPAAFGDLTRMRLQCKKGGTPLLNAGGQYMPVALTFGQRCAKPKVVFSFDKSYVSQIPAMRYLAANGLPFASSLIASQLGQVVGADTVMTAAQLAEIAATTQGLLIPHTVNTVAGSGSDAAALSQLLGNIEAIEALGLPNFDKRFVKYASGSYSFSNLDDGLADLLRNSGWCQGALISSGGGQVGPWWRDRHYARRQIFQGPTADPAVEAAAVENDLKAGRSRIISAHNFSADGAGASEITIAKFRALVDSVVGFSRGGLCDIVGLPEYVAALE